MWGCLLGGVLLCVGIICGMALVLVTSGLARLIGRLT